MKHIWLQGDWTATNSEKFSIYGSVSIDNIPHYFCNDCNGQIRSSDLKSPNLLLHLPDHLKRIRDPHFYCVHCRIMARIDRLNIGAPGVVSVENKCMQLIFYIHIIINPLALQLILTLPSLSNFRVPMIKTHTHSDFILQETTRINLVVLISRMFV